ncbi:MAG TPA: RNA polymerase sigma factor [Candidatus Binataceae bacterium]|nr:RNA polymerase sigma factor [Candidatus Binataceae bacterium]
MVAIDEAEKSGRWTQLMERVQDGDQQAFRTLFDEVGPSIARFVRRRVADQSEAEDICQETLIAIFKSRHTYQPTRPFEPWLYAIARNVISRSFSHSLQRVRWLETVAELPEVEGEGHAVQSVELREAFARLSPNQQEAVRLTKVDGLSIAEASRVAGASVGSMKVRVHRAYQSLRESLRR